VQVLCLCIAWSGYELDTFVSGGAFMLLLGLQAVILVIMGAAQVGAAVGGAHASGILDFHRVSPLSPTALVLGFFFGAPIREYVLFATTLPWAPLYLAVGTPSVHGFVQLMIATIAAAWLFHGLALMNGLFSRRRSGMRDVPRMIALVYVLTTAATMGVNSSVKLVDMGLRLSFFGVSLPWLAVVLIYLSVLLYFIYLACVRKMASERIHALSKPQAVAAMAALSVLVLGGIWKQDHYEILLIVTLYTLVVAAVLLLATVTPSQAEYVKGLWRARKRGRSHLPPWDDLSLNRVFLVIVCAIALVTATFAWQASPTPNVPGAGPVMTAFPLAIACGVLVVAYFGLALQFFRLRFGGRGLMYFGLFLFLAWILPLVAGTIGFIASMSVESDPTGQTITALSPVAGLGMMAAGASQPENSTRIQAATITPALLFTFVFNSLLIAARHRVYKAFVILAARQNLGKGRPPEAVAKSARDSPVTAGAEGMLE
jgi:hypothetical protein